tara:strand:+ start:6140 stop:6466 length:327 start_codon:yes stop_codon:yes gene_type:complete
MNNSAREEPFSLSGLSIASSVRTHDESFPTTYNNLETAVKEENERRQAQGMPQIPYREQKESKGTVFYFRSGDAPSIKEAYRAWKIIQDHAKLQERLEKLREERPYLF